MIPEFGEDGNLPEGIHNATWAEIKDKFSWNKKRASMLDKFWIALHSLKKAGCKRVYIDGSFVTSKHNPNDIDCVWETEGVEVKNLDIVFKDITPSGRNRQKLLFESEFFPDSVNEDASHSSFLGFFQRDKETGNPKGIVALELGDIE